MSCDGDGCTATCSGADSCNIDSCDNSCVLTCGGAAECENSCPVTAGCVTG